MKSHFRSTLLFVLALFAFAGIARAGEFVDGNNPPTARNNMHSCPRGAIVTGVHVNNNQLLCLGHFADPAGFLTTGETVTSGLQWPPDSVTRAAHAYPGPAIPWCGPDRYVTGVHVANRSFNCSQFPTAGNRNYTPRLGHIVVDYGTSPTVRQNMHACPRGFVMVGANFDTNTFLCAELPFCQESAHCPGGSNGEVCEFNSTGCATSACISPTTGVCRRQGQLSFREDNGCVQDFVGGLTDRSANLVDFTNHDAFTNDEARSLQLSNVRAGTIIRVYDSPSGATNDDWAQIFVKNTTTTCVGTFQTALDTAFVKVDSHPVNGLDGKVSRVDLRSAILDDAGRRCLDVNMNNNAAQLFDCHAGPNQSWIYEVDGEIRGINNLCLEANSAEIHTWPNLTAAQRRAAVRVANCNGSVHQKWTVTEAGQLRMFADMCLDITNGTSQNNAAVQLAPCSGAQRQRWLSSF